MNNRQENKRTIQTERINKPHHVERPYQKPLMSSQLTIINKLSQSDANHTHEVFRARKSGPDFLADLPEKLIPMRYKNNWYLKKGSSEIPVREVIAQEIFRLCIPHQPKTRLVQAKGNEFLYVLSKEIPGFIPFDKIDSNTLQQNLINGSYHGLGEVLVMSLFVNEIDLHRGNIGINNKGQVIKIDGGYSFGEFSFARNHFEITANDIRLLPLIKDYNAANWSDFIYQFEHFEHSSFSIFQRYDFSNHPGIRHEINSAILRVALLPIDVIKRCVQDCIPSILEAASEESVIAMKKLAEKCYSELLNRQSQLIDAGLKNESFRTYLLSADAKNDLANYVESLRDHTTIGKRGLQVEKYENEIYNNFKQDAFDGFSIRKMRTSVDAHLIRIFA